jgi:hypothetical protein
MSRDRAGQGSLGATLFLGADDQRRLGQLPGLVFPPTGVRVQIAGHGTGTVTGTSLVVDGTESSVLVWVDLDPGAPE